VLEFEAVRSLLGNVAFVVICQPLRDVCEAGCVVEHVAWEGDLAREVGVEEADVHVLGVPAVEEAAEDGGVEEVLVCGVYDVPDGVDGSVLDDGVREEGFLTCVGLRVVGVEAAALCVGLGLVVVCGSFVFFGDLHV
jgi:hypothetical protein